MELVLSATPVTASPLMSSLSFCKFRTNHSCLVLSSDPVPGISSRFRVFIPRRKLNAEDLLLVLPIHRRVMRTFASIGSLESDVKHHQSNVRSGNLSDLSVKPSDRMNEFEKELQELFDEVKRMIAVGKSSDAAVLLQANFEAVREKIDAGAKGIEEVATLDIIALGYMALGDLKIVDFLLEMMDEVIQNIQDDEPVLASVLTHMGSMYSTLGKFEKSILVYRRAVGILENLYGGSSKFLVVPLLGFAKSMGYVRRATKAVEIYHRAITILESSKGADSEDLVVPLFSLGNLLINEGRVKDAEYPLTRILNIYIKLYGEKDGRVGLALSYLARAEYAKGDLEGAILSYRKALQLIKDSNYMPLHDSVMERMRIDLAELLHLVGRSNEGREVLEECLLITEEYNGRDHPNSVTHLLNLATSYSRSKNYVEAERFLRTGLEIMIRTVGPDDESITYPMLHLAVTLSSLKRDEEAEQLANEVLQIREKAFGKDAFPVGEALDCLVSIQARLGRDDSELVGLLERVLKIQEKEFGYESEEVMVTLQKIVFYLNKLGRKDEKFQLQKRLTRLKEKIKQSFQT